MKLTRKEVQWCRRNRGHLTNEQLRAHINGQRREDAQMGVTTFRTLLYKHNIKKNTVLGWTAKETQFLLDNYRTMGNLELSAILTKKRRRILKKNIEKKMILLGLKRTPEELQAIIDGHKAKGTYHRANKKRHKNMGAVQEGEIKVQVVNGRPRVSIKVNGLLKPYARHRYVQLHGEPPKGYKIFFRDWDPLNIADDNLVAMKGRKLTHAEIALYDKNCRAYLSRTRTAKATQPKPEPRPVPAEPRAQRIGVRLNARTVVYVPPGTNIERLRARYENRPRY